MLYEYMGGFLYIGREMEVRKVFLEEDQTDSIRRKLCSRPRNDMEWREREFKIIASPTTFSEPLANG